MESLRFVLPQSEIPTHWYNVVADMPNAPLPPLGPDGNPATPERHHTVPALQGGNDRKNCPPASVIFTVQRPRH